MTNSNMKAELLTLDDCIQNAQQMADAPRHSQDSLVIDLYTQTQRIEDEMTMLNEMHVDNDVMIIPLPVQCVMANLQRALDDLQNVLMDELATRGELAECVPLLGSADIDESQPLDFN